MQKKPNKIIFIVNACLVLYLFNYLRDKRKQLVENIQNTIQ